MSETKALPAHHPTLAPSSWPAIMQCAKFKSGGDDGHNYDSIGTELHKVMECLAHKQPIPELKHAEKDHIERCLEVWERAKRIVDQECPGHGELITEERTVLRDDNGEVVTYGTLDVNTHNETVLVVLDWKSGLSFNVNRYDHTPQLECYALSKMRELGLEKAVIIIGYIMPGIVKVSYTDYAQASAVADCVLARRADENAYARRCQWCRYCSRLMWCPAVNNSTKLIHAGFRDLDPETVLNPEEVVEPDQMSSLLLFAMDQLGPMADRINALRSLIIECGLRMVENNVTIPYFVKKVKTGVKVLERPAEAMKLLELSPEEFLSAAKISLPKLAKAYQQRAGGTLKAAREEMEGTLFELLKTPEPKATLEFKPEVQSVRECSQADIRSRRVPSGTGADGARRP